MHKVVPSNLAQLWAEILKTHWSFLEAEESLQNLEERQKLEGYLKEFLCIVPHDRRFFLPETAQVLRKSLQKSSGSNVYKAIIGFQSISQYANNLFTRPWRKEFHILKMYSGYFQHEINANLVDAVKLFEAMGYRRLSDDILILDGPICPDQVTNVSRDAMAAYIECKIIKQIYAGLVTMGLSCSWKEILHYRENNVGGPSQAIKNLIHIIQERESNKENLLNIDNFSAVGHRIAQQNATYSQPIDASCHANKSNYMAPQGNSFNSQCCLHGSTAFREPQQSHIYDNISNDHIISKQPYAGESGPKAPSNQSHIAHSRSLEHYNEVPVSLPHRHSFDNQQDGCIAAHHHKYYHHPYIPPQNIYESPYDCLDGVSMGSSASYAAVAATTHPNSNMNSAYNMHPYNISGNRYPLPYNISNELNELYTMPTIPCNNLKRDPYKSVENDYATISKKSNCDNYLQSSARHINPSTATKDFSNMRQRAFPAEQLIDFNDRAPMLLHDNHAQNYLDYGENNGTSLHCLRNDKNIIGLQPSESSSQLLSSEGSSVYARPSRLTRSRASTESSNAFDGGKYATSTQDFSGSNKLRRDMKVKDRCTHGDTSGDRITKQCLKHTNERDKSRGPSGAVDDFIPVGQGELPQRSLSQHHKNQDGVGSFESWNYVFQNLERSGYSKDLREHDDLLVQDLELDSLNLASDLLNSTEKRRKNHIDAAKAAGPAPPNGAGALDHVAKLAKGISANATDELDSKAGSILKQISTNATSSTKKSTKSSAKVKIITNHDNNNENENAATTPATTNAEMRRSEHKKSLGGKTHAMKRASDNLPGQKLAAAQQMLASSSSEWSCRFCTFLNPGAERICEMCYHSKDFNLEVNVNTAPACV